MKNFVNEILNFVYIFSPALVVVAITYHFVQTNFGEKDMREWMNQPVVIKEGKVYYENSPPYFVASKLP